MEKKMGFSLYIFRTFITTSVKGSTLGFKEIIS
jgi:hypothetical protein